MTKTFNSNKVFINQTMLDFFVVFLWKLKSHKCACVSNGNVWNARHFHQSSLERERMDALEPNAVRSMARDRKDVVRGLRVVDVG
jgi:hypothetical protein